MKTQCVTFSTMWSDTVSAQGESTFLLFEDAEGIVNHWTYREFDDVVRGTETLLRLAGVSSGSVVHVVLHNCPAFVAVWLATARIGAVAVFADPGLKQRDLDSQIQRTSPVVAVCGRTLADEYTSAVDRSAAAITIIAVEQTSADVAYGGALHHQSSADNESRAGASPHDPLAVMFTSGTTSAPKGVVLTQCNYVHVGQRMAAAAALRPEHRWLVTLPLFHANAQYYCLAPAIAVGASVALTHRFSASCWPHQADRLSVTHASLFAAPIRMILARRRADAPALSLQHVWFAQSLAAGHFQEFGSLVGVLPRQLYGMTETVSVVCVEGLDDPRPDMIGDPRAAGRTTLVVDPETHTPVSTGTPGVLLVQGRPGCDLFKEYLSDPAITAATLLRMDGDIWLRTGDLVSADTSGRLSFIGRVDDVIKVAGENVSLTEVEATLAQVPGVLEVAVIPRPDAIRDVVPVAYIVARDPHTPPTVSDLDQWSSENLPPQARPRDWHFLDELPRTSVGKIRRSQLPQHINTVR